MSIQIELEILSIYRNVRYILLMATYTSDSFSLLILSLLLRQLHKEYLKYRLELFLVFISYKIKEILG